MGTLKHELREAARGGYSRTLQQLVFRGYDVDSCDDDGWTPLIFGAHGGHLAVVQLLHRADCNLAARDRHGLSALHVACDRGHLEVAEYLTTHLSQQQCDSVDLEGHTPFMLSAAAGFLPIVKYLLKNCHVDINSYNMKRQTSLHLAVHKGHIDVVKFLVKHGATLDRRDEPGNMDGDTALMYASKYNKLDILDVLLNAGADASKLNRLGLTAITIAAEMGHVNIVKKLLPHSPCAKYASKLRLIGDSPLVAAARKDKLAVAELLINSNVTRDVKKAFLEAARLGHLEIVQLLVERLPSLAFRESDEAILIPKLLQDVFLISVIQDRIAVAQYLLKQHVADINGWAVGGYVPLHAAVQGGHTDMVRLLVENGARINARHQVYECTPFIMAATQGFREIMEILLASCKNNVDVFQETLCSSDAHNNTALHCAISQNHMDCVQLLLCAKMDVNIQIDGHLTPLHIAANTSNVDMIKILLEAGASTDILDKERTPPLFLAIDNNAISCSWYILDYPCSPSAYVMYIGRMKHTVLRRAVVLAGETMCNLLLDSASSQNELEILLDDTSFGTPPVWMSLAYTLARNPRTLRCHCIKVIRHALSAGPKSSLAKHLPLPHTLIADVILSHYV